MCTHIARRLLHCFINVRLQTANISALVIQTDETVSTNGHGHNAVAVATKLADSVIDEHGVKIPFAKVFGLQLV
jgi:hypothetical protein